MTLFDERDADRSKVESIVFAERQPTRRSRTSWIPAARPAMQGGLPNAVAVPPPPGVPGDAAAPVEHAAVLRQEAHASAHAAAHETLAHASEKAEAMRTRAERAARSLEQALHQIAELRPAVLADAEQQLVELALAIARRVVHRELERDRAVVVEFAKQGIAALAESDRVLVRLGVSLEESATATLGQAMGRKGTRLEIVRDESLPPDACVVETEFGRVDESLDARFAQVEAALRAPKTGA